jgi:hypothetical protein
MKGQKCKSHSRLKKYLNALVSRFQECEDCIKTLRADGPNVYGESYFNSIKIARLKLNTFKNEIKQVKLKIKAAQRKYDQDSKKVDIEKVGLDTILKDLYFGKYTLNKPQFVAIMTIIKDMMDRDCEFGNGILETLNKHNGGSSENRPYDMFDNLALSEYNGKTVGKLIQWLVSVMGDHSCGDKVSDSWIAYYIYETDWGHSFDDTPVMSEDGTPIPFKTIGDVYDLIVDHKK